jgi:superoxide dismutase, Cu-Zn family
MRKPIFVAVALGLLSTAAFAVKAGPSASATLMKADGTAAGKAVFSQKADGVWLKVDVMGLEPGKHGIHLHTVGKCDAPDFSSAGGHWNPMHKMHGFESPQGSHTGDLPNLDVDSKGNGKIEALVHGATLDSGMMGLFDSDGTALVIHAGPDDNRTDPSGNSGGRIACGVVTAS